MSIRPPLLRAHLANYPHPVVLSIQVGRNLILQGLGIAMVAVTGLGALQWPAVLAWTVCMLAAAIAEQQILKTVVGSSSRTIVGQLAPALRFLSTTLYALAALALIVKGEAGDRLFAFALMSASTINVLMRYYRSPVILIASLSPYILILGGVAAVLAQSEWRKGDMWGVVGSAFALALFALQLWSARAQLSRAWTELTDRQHAADAANRAKSQFLASMSHELRTPLNGVLGMAQALAAEELTPAQRDQVMVIRRSSETLLAVLNDLLDLSKIEASALSLEVVEFDMELLLRGIADVYQPRAEKQKLTFGLEVTEQARGVYLGDSARLQRILCSLCDNALKFTPSGAVALKVDHAGERVVIKVSDTGIGIAASDLPHLFGRFFQADGSFTRHYDGAGLGLAICSDLTRLMGGEIQASSQVGGGSTFTVWLPLPRSDPVARHAPAVAPAKGRGGGQLRVLAAEDHPTNRLVLKSLLAVAGIEPVFANDGREAVEAWESQAWDIILMDIQMPQMNGVEATQVIRGRELETGRPRTPIIAVTANAMTHQVAEYRESGIDEVVAKPVGLTMLLAAMELALSVDQVAAEGPRALCQVNLRQS